ncbi:DUF2846 domain-containing protein [Bradyrhizobium zhanjiangense]|uniref:DUF2846 domain-containing protein n=1 Tax=Bradyrhizobium zhanjiangense TaxID=1325107 RepID=A0A4V1KWM9_9BRAD|nr:DUF2846 domain-containing protein [Bradyrhizobium zhanjiangense]
MRLGVGIFAVATLLAGCASGPMGDQALTENVKSNTARLVVYRSSALGFAVQPNYAVDGRVIGGSQAAGFLVCDLPPGRHEVAVNNLPLSSNLFGQGSEKVSLELRAGSTTYLSAQPQMGIVTPGAITLIQVTESQGRADVAKLHQSNGSCDKA